MEMTDTFKKELSRRVVNSGSRDFVLPAKPSKFFHWFFKKSFFKKIIRKNAKRFNIKEVDA